MNSLSLLGVIQALLQLGRWCMPSLAAAVEAYTLNAGYALEQETGSIEVSKYADLVMLSQSIFSLPSSHIGATKAWLTMLEGEIIYQHPNF
ncbi:amidohydrolase family protein [Microbulbifer sp. 2201CG32-9]|uniref:amidohydrolase family protein n=1 Tax=Microbulbifer sp. 2201CG32-9 TaxID=3232309 RepID=UPI00345B82A5